MLGPGEESAQRIEAWLIAMEAGTRKEVFLCTDPAWHDWAIDRERAMFHFDFANGILVLNKYVVSVTCEVRKDGRSRWFLTKESGRRPAYCDSECRGDEGHMSRDVVLEAKQAYVVLKIDPLTPFEDEPSQSVALFQRLSLAGLEGLARVAMLVRKSALSNEGDGSMALRFWRFRMPKGMVAAGRSCRCSDNRTFRCSPCSVVQRHGGDMRWCVTNHYKHDGGRYSMFPWFNGRSDAVGEVISRQGLSRDWLSCPRATR